MATGIVQISIDEALRAQAEEIYQELGIDLQTAIQIFLKRSVAEKGLPFSLKLEEKKPPASEADVKAIQSMSFDEISAEIAAARAERRKYTESIGAGPPDAATAFNAAMRAKAAARGYRGEKESGGENAAARAEGWKSSV